MKIYWTTYIDQIPNLSLAIRPPTRLLNNITGDIKNTNFPMCGAFHEHHKNTYVVNSPIEYKLNIYTEQDRWESPNSKVLDTWSVFQDMQNCVVQFKTGLLFFAESDVNLTVMHPFLHHTDLTENGNVLSGAFNIAKWSRPIQAAYYFQRKPSYSIDVKEDTPLIYVNFDAVERVKLEYFHMSPTINNIVQQCLGLKDSRYRPWSLKDAYKRFENKRNHKLLMNEIKQQKKDNL